MIQAALECLDGHVSSLTYVFHFTLISSWSIVFFLLFGIKLVWLIFIICWLWGRFCPEVCYWNKHVSVFLEYWWCSGLDFQLGMGLCWYLGEMHLCGNGLLLHIRTRVLLVMINCFMFVSVQRRPLVEHLYTVILVLVFLVLFLVKMKISGRLISSGFLHNVCQISFFFRNGSMSISGQSGHNVVYLWLWIQFHRLVSLYQTWRSNHVKEGGCELWYRWYLVERRGQKTRCPLQFLCGYSNGQWMNDDDRQSTSVFLSRDFYYMVVLVWLLFVGVVKGLFISAILAHQSKTNYFLCEC